MLTSQHRPQLLPHRAPHLFQVRVWQAPLPHVAIRGTRRHPVTASALPDHGGSDPGSGSGGDPPVPPATELLTLSTVLYAAMAAGAVYLGDRSGTVDIRSLYLQADWQAAVQPALVWTGGMLIYPVLGVQMADKWEGFREMRQLFQTAIIPSLEPLPLWGLALLAFGAGFGEESMFRGFIQTAAVGSLAESLPQGLAVAAGLGGVSLLFGALHAATPTYFWFATGAGLTLGIEYLTAGLPAASMTHTLYDFIALVYVIREWGGAKQGGGSTDGQGWR